MSLTQTHHAFAAINQQGTNRAINIFFGTRPHYLHYGSPPFVTGNSVGVTLLPTIAFPGLPGGIPWAVDLTLPVVDLFPADGPLPNPLTLGADQLAISTNVTITIGCIEPTEKPGGGSVTPLRTTLEVIAIAHPLTQFFSPGVGDVFLRVDELLLPEVAPPSLQVALDCLIRMILEAAISAFPLPLTVLDAGFFKLTIEEGPTVADDQIKLRGSVS